MERKRAYELYIKCSIVTEMDTPISRLKWCEVFFFAFTFQVTGATNHKQLSLLPRDRLVFLTSYVVLIYGHCVDCNERLYCRSF